jgi:hypothetical protein
MSSDAPQQSARAEHAAPSATHSVVHVRAPLAPGTHRAPAQHSLATAHAAPAAAHGGGGIFLHRFGPADIGGSCTHFVPGQQSPSAPQISPSAPHPAAWQRIVPFASGAHPPEQQSAADVHVSHSARQPPAGAQRFVPSRVATHEREQHSVASRHTSPT